jgi:hypothetical protein
LLLKEPDKSKKQLKRNKDKKPRLRESDLSKKQQQRPKD